MAVIRSVSTDFLYIFDNKTLDSVDVSILPFIIIFSTVILKFPFTFLTANQNSTVSLPEFFPFSIRYSLPFSLM